MRLLDLAGLLSLLSEPVGYTQINQNGGSCAQPAQGWGRGYISGTPYVSQTLQRILAANALLTTPPHNVPAFRLSLYHQSTNSPWNNINN